MNKKIFGLLLVFGALFSVCTLESCKDTNTDLYNEVLIQQSQQYQDLLKRINAIQVGDIDGAKAELRAEIASLKSQLLAELEKCATKADLDALTARVNNLEDRVAALEEEVKKLADLANQATSIEVRSVYSSAFGSLNTPFGVTNNILVAYYNHTDDEIMFNGEAVGGDLISENAGKIYMSVNPANVDFSGVNVSLVNSVGEDSGVELSPLAVSGEVITMGYTRANNYLYETTAKITSADKVQRFELNMSDFKAAAKQILANKDLNSIKNLAELLFLTVNNQLPLNTVQIEAKDRVLVSDVNVVATAVKPINLQQMGALNDKIEKLELDKKFQNFVEKIEDAEIEGRPNLNKIKNVVEKLLYKAMPLVDVASRLGHAANPAIYVLDGCNLRVLSTDPKNPTVLENAEVDFYPTSYSLELLVPFYKKNIKVTSPGAVIKIGEDGVTVPDGGLNFDGSTSVGTMNVVASGSSVAEIKYQVLDYSLNKETRTYYVKTK
ncbi:MAG: hypothetical protein HUJ97_04600 [Bacteroidales bacterium]|nr:hypothetical protein [Bacteroidales bacterium]